MAYIDPNPNRSKTMKIRIVKDNVYPVYGMVSGATGVMDWMPEVEVSDELWKEWVVLEREWGRMQRKLGGMYEEPEWVGVLDKIGKRVEK